jgi:quinol monooxygenase YgiN
MIALTELAPRPESRESILDILNSVASLTSLKSGCVSCGIYEKYDEERLILYIEQWRSKEEFYRHIQSDAYMRLLAAMDLATRVPKVGFYTASEPTGIELVRDLRIQKKKE